FGVRRADIYTSAGTTELPGYFRPSTSWDMVVVVRDRLLVAIELRAVIGSKVASGVAALSDDALARVMDVRIAARAGAFGSTYTPWLGYILLVEDGPVAHRPAAFQEPLFPAADDFRAATHVGIYQSLVTKLARDGYYDAGCFLVSKQADAD